LPSFSHEGSLPKSTHAQAGVASSEAPRRGAPRGRRVAHAHTTRDRGTDPSSEPGRVMARSRETDETGAMFIDAVPEGAATGELADYYRQQRDSWGFLPNYAAAFSARPDVARAWNALNATVRGGMDRRRFEIATIAASRALRSTYCTAAHSTF